MTPQDLPPPPPTPVSPVSGDIGDPAPGAAPTPAPARASLRAAGAWVLLVGVAVALDGMIGGLALVVVAAVLLAGLPTRLLGALGVGLLVLVPVAVVVDGIPTGGEISPAFVLRSLVPHHLTFAGLVLVCAYALIDLAPHLRQWAAAERAPQDDGPPLGVVLGAVVVALVAVGAVAACASVLGG